MNILIFLSILLFSLSSLEGVCGFDGYPTYDECFCDCIEDARIEFSFTGGNFISIDKAYGSFGVLKPLCLSEEYRPFLDLKGIVFTDARWAATGGAGYRGRLADSFLFGVNAYYDYRRGDCKNSFHQIGFGLECLHECFDARINGYFPIGKDSQPCCKKGREGKDSPPCFKKCREFAYTGFDASVGATLLSYCGFNLYASAGTYHFSERVIHFWGGFGTIELDWKTMVSVQARISNDHIYGKNVQGIVQLSFPLELFYVINCHECYCCRDLLSLPVRRIGMILVDSFCKK